MDLDLQLLTSANMQITQYTLIPVFRCSGGVVLNQVRGPTLSLQAILMSIVPAKYLPLSICRAFSLQIALESVLSVI